MNPVMYIFLNRGLGMSTGKAAAQASHAAVLASDRSDPKLRERWNRDGHYTKLIMLAEDERQLANISDYLAKRGFSVFHVIDEGHTEIRPFTFTALGVEIVDKDDERTASIFSEFKLYKNTKPQIQFTTPYPSTPKKHWWCR